MATKTWLGNDAGNIGDWDTADNWNPSGVPIAADDVIFANNSQDVLDGLDQSAIALATLTIDQSYTGNIGNAQDSFLQVGAVILEIGQIRGTGTQTGSKRLNIDLGTTTASEVTVYNSATRGIDPNRSPIRLRAVNASTNITTFGGSLALSDDSSNSSTIGNFTCNAGSVSIGESVTLTNFTQKAGIVTAYSSFPGTINLKGGTLNFYDSLSVSTMGTVNSFPSSILNHFASGTITAS